jgi:exosortase J
VIACISGVAFLSATSAKAELTRTAEQRFPERIGNYSLVRTWAETTTTGTVVYQWAEYAPPTGTSVAIGIAPGLSWHDPIICHTIRGEHPVWQGPLEVATALRPVSFNSALYFDGIVAVLDASTQCSTGGCNEFATPRKHLGLIYSPVDRGTLLGRARSLPVLVRAELPSSFAAPDDALRGKLASAIQSFVASADLAALTRP